MTIMDWVVTGLLVLAAIFGFMTGIKKKLSKKLGWLGGFVIATLFYAMLANFILSKTSLGEWGMNQFDGILMEKGQDSESLQYLSMNYQDAMTNKAEGYDFDSTMASCLGVVGIPSIFASFFMSKIYYTTGTVSQALASGIFESIAYGVVYLVLYFVSSLILVAIFNWLLGVNKGGKGVGDRLMGMLVKVLWMSVTILTIMFVMTLIGTYVESFNTWLVEQVGYGSGNVTISGIFYNLSWQIINMFRLSTI